ncbi:hypothetical protein [Hymenobacter convexus]|uniref:hypothetical protein n=1 Tax=Hymenobacter sp. CA1UV-4 TaxID=3063782 RepID=UPI0027136DE1|nr:hypothetical protein [Hymenobacter sp. CA1UV-4]MDO7852004.1 hypothetical protein [Hymenobacter sp. CA1UV-4]
MEPLSPVPAGRYAELDLLRFLASLAVVLLHFTYSIQRAACWCCCWPGPPTRW